MEDTLIDPKTMHYIPNTINKSKFKLEGVCEECKKKVEDYI
jgi:hypothetical protein